MEQTGPVEAPDLVGTGIQEMVAEARRLGLKDRIQLATVVTVNPLTVRVDGDTSAIQAVSTIGPRSIGERVFVLAVPPAGNYVFGSVSQGVMKQIETGIELVQVTPAATSFTQVASFDQIWALKPTVTININSGAGETAQWHVRAINVTTLGFTTFLFKTMGTAANEWAQAYEIHWQAIAQ